MPETHSGSRGSPWDGEVAIRAGWSLTWLAVLAAGLQLEGAWYYDRTSIALSCFLSLAGLIGLARTWTARTPPNQHLQMAGIACVVLAILSLAHSMLLTVPGPRTDEAAFSQYAAQLLAHGHNPYRSSMDPVLHIFTLPAHFLTLTLNGGHISRLSYPAASFLPTAALVLAGAHKHAVDLADVTIWCGAIVCLWRLMPPSANWLAGPLGLLGALLGDVVGGVLDPLYVLPLIFAAWRWDRFGRADELTAARWVGPVAFGVACSVKQNPWFLIPFVLLGVAMERRSRDEDWVGPVVRYAGVVVLTFLAINAPFIALDPLSWARGVWTPLIAPTVPAGQGVISLFLHLGPSSVRLSLLTVCAVLAYLCTIAAYARWYSSLRSMWPILPAAAFFLSARSFSTYFLFAVPALLVSTSTGPAQVTTPLRGAVRSLARVITPVLGLGSVGMMALVVVLPGPISLSAVSATRSSGVIASVMVTVTNRSEGVLDVHLGVTSADEVDEFWLSPSGRSTFVIAPHSSRLVRLLPPAEPDRPYSDVHWEVMAFTASPATVAVSAPM
jgi:uncharacterized membrane protein